MLLPESSVIPHPSSPPALLSNPALAANLHAVLSSRTPISHPLCTECTTLLQSELQKELEELSLERDAYIEFQRGIQRHHDQLKKRRTGDGLGEYDIEGTEDEWEGLVKKKRELDKEEERLKRALEEKEKELQAARKDQERIKLEEQRVDKEEEE